MSRDEAVLVASNWLEFDDETRALLKAQDDNTHEVLTKEFVNGQASIEAV